MAAVLLHACVLHTYVCNRQILLFQKSSHLASANPVYILSNVLLRVLCSLAFLVDAWSSRSSSSVYSPFSDRVGLPHHNTPFPGVLMKSIGAVFLLPNALPDVNHTRGMQYQIVLNIIFLPEMN